jgi:hypothetical protein
MIPMQKTIPNLKLDWNTFDPARKDSLSVLCPAKGLSSQKGGLQIQGMGKQEGGHGIVKV